MYAEINPFHPMILLCVAFVGLSLGSFATACIWRIPRGEQFITGRSHCPTCHHALGFIDLFPFFSWIWLRGKCRHCGVVFGAHYLITEAITALLVLLFYSLFGWNVLSIIYALLALILVITSQIERKHTIIPQGLLWFIALLTCGKITLDYWQHTLDWRSITLSFFLITSAFIFSSLVKKQSPNYPLITQQIIFAFILTFFLPLIAIPVYLLIIIALKIITGFVSICCKNTTTLPWCSLFLWAFTLSLVLSRIM